MAVDSSWDGVHLRGPCLLGTLTSVSTVAIYDGVYAVLVYVVFGCFRGARRMGASVGSATVRRGLKTVCWSGRAADRELSTLVKHLHLCTGCLRKQ